MAKPKVTTDARGHIHIRLDAGVAATVSRGVNQRTIDSLRKMAKAAKDASTEGWSRSDYDDAIRKVEEQINRAIKSGARITENDPLNQRLKKLRAERARAVDSAKPCGCKH